MITGAPQADAALIMVPAGGNSTTADAKGYHSGGKIQGQTRQHSRLISLLGIKQIYTEDCDTAGYEQEWYDKISSDLKNMMIKCQHSKTVPILNVRCSAHSWFTTDFPICANSSASFCKIRFCTAATVEQRMLGNSVEGNPHFHHESSFGTSLLFVDVENPPGQDSSIDVISLLYVAGPCNSSDHEKRRVRRLHLRVYHRSEWEDHH